MVSGKGFEVPRRVYVDFEGINLRRKFLTGLEPETINMTIGKDCRGVVCSWFEPLDCTEMKYACCISHSLYRPSFLSHVSRLSADSETWCVVRAVVKWEDAVPCRISVSDHCHTTGSVTDRVSMQILCRTIHDSFGNFGASCRIIIVLIALVQVSLLFHFM